MKISKVKKKGVNGTIIFIFIFLIVMAVFYFSLTSGDSNKKLNTTTQNQLNTLNTTGIAPTIKVKKTASERALKAVTYAWFDVSKKEQQVFISEFTKDMEFSKEKEWVFDKDVNDWVSVESYVLNKWALRLDENLSELVRIETLIDKAKAESSRPIINNESSSKQPIEVKVESPRTPVNCSTNTIGNYTYTNCY